MAFLAGVVRYFTGSRTGIPENTDDPLNRGDQAANIRSRIRQLDVERSLDVLKSSSPLLVLGAGGWLLLKRRYGAGFVALGGLLLLQALKGRKDQALDSQKARDRELERYALKLERGDYGHFEVIPFR